MKRADTESHHWNAGSGLTVQIEKTPNKINPALTLSQGERSMTIEVCQLDLQALESAIVILRQIKDASLDASAGALFVFDVEHDHGFHP
jgi:hypothetical protein